MAIQQLIAAVYFIFDKREIKQIEKKDLLENIFINKTKEWSTINGRRLFFNSLGYPIF